MRSVPAVPRTPRPDRGPDRTASRRAGAVLAAGVLGLALAACGGTNSPSGSKDVQVSGPINSLGPTASPSLSETPSSSPTASSTPSGSPSESSGLGVEQDAQGYKVVDVTVTGNRVTPNPGRVEIENGQQVRLTVTSDVDNELHVHGLEIVRPVKAGQPTTVEFVPDKAGVYDVELHDPQLLLFKVAIR